jgi:hypothetical protein
MDSESRPQDDDHEEDRPLLMSMAKAARRLDICSSTLQAHVAAGDIPYVLIGRRTKKFRPEDLELFIEHRRRQEVPCPSTSRRESRTITTTSSSGAYDFMAARARRTEQRRSRSKLQSA